PSSLVPCRLHARARSAPSLVTPCSSSLSDPQPDSAPTPPAAAAPVRGIARPHPEPLPRRRPPNVNTRSEGMRSMRQRLAAVTLIGGLTTLGIGLTAGAAGANVNHCLGHPRHAHSGPLPAP